MLYGCIQGLSTEGVEMTSTIIDADNSVINKQVTNGVAVRMALLYLLTGRKNFENINYKWKSNI